MKRLALMLVLVVAGMLILQGSAFCYSIDDPWSTAVDDASPDRIGNIVFEIYGLDYRIEDSTDLIVDLYTNYPDAPVNTDHPASSGPLTYVGDLSITVEGVEYGVILGSVGLGAEGSLYQVSSWYTSDDFLSSYEGAKYRSGSDVKIAGGTYVSQADVQWNNDVGNPDYRIQITLDDFLPAEFSGTLDFYWPVATCANDIVEGSVITAVPEPATALLVATGLVGLVAGYGRKKILGRRQA